MSSAVVAPAPHGKKPSSRATSASVRGSALFAAAGPEGVAGAGLAAAGDAAADGAFFGSWAFPGAHPAISRAAIGAFSRKTRCVFIVSGLLLSLNVVTFVSAFGPESNQDVSRGDRGSRRAVHGRDSSVARRLHLVFHFHGLENDQRLSGSDGIARRYEHFEDTPGHRRREMVHALR